MTSMDVRPRSAKRRRTSTGRVPVTPPASEIDTPASHVDAARRAPLLERAAHVLATEAAALSAVTALYRTSAPAQTALVRAVEAVAGAHAAGGKLVVCGVGKSAYVGMKLVATCKSLGVGASFLHACEAVHGDLGDVRSTDVLLFISFSGNTPELLALLPHLPRDTRVVALSSHVRPTDCALLRDREDGILLPAPIPEKEEASFGVAAPTTSTTVALAVADMLALTVAEQLHCTPARMRDIFATNHPGGAIGMKHREAERLAKDDTDLTGLDLLLSPSISGSDAG